MTFKADIHVTRTTNAAGAVTSINQQAYDNAATPAVVQMKINGMTIGSDGGLLSSSTTGLVGYTTGAGGTVTQITSRTTGVTLSTVCGSITTDVSSLAAEVAAEFVVTNTLVAVGDVVVISIRSGTNGGNTAVNVTTVAAGSFKLKVSNNNAAAGAAETGAIIITFAIIRAVTA